MYFYKYLPKYEKILGTILNHWRFHIYILSTFTAHKSMSTTLKRQLGTSLT